jgi:hypothetical protein
MGLDKGISVFTFHSPDPERMSRTKFLPVQLAG